MNAFAILVASLLLLAPLCHDLKARIGETKEELTQRYGSPTKQNDKLIFFTKNGFSFQFFMSDAGKAILVVINKVAGVLSDDEIKIFMEKNGMKDVQDCGNPEATLQSIAHQMELANQGSLDELKTEKALEPRHMWASCYEDQPTNSTKPTEGRILAIEELGGESAYKYHAIFDKTDGTLVIWSDDGHFAWTTHKQKMQEKKAQSQLEGF